MKEMPAGVGKKGFTLLEVAVVLAALALVTTAAIPYFIRQAELTAAQRTTKEVSSIQEASKWYYLNNKVWPASVRPLQSAGFLNPSWSLTNPWGNTYLISSAPTRLRVTTTVPNSIAGVLSRALPAVSSRGSGGNQIVSSSIPVPGQEASLTTVTNLAANAQSTANSAQSTANNASSRAKTAQSTAVTAQNTANFAQSMANSARTTANNAQNTANKALSFAQSSALPPYGSQVRVSPESAPPPRPDGSYRCPSGYVMIGLHEENSRGRIPRYLLCRRVRR